VQKFKEVDVSLTRSSAISQRGCLIPVSFKILLFAVAQISLKAKGNGTIQ